MCMYMNMYMYTPHPQTTCTCTSQSFAHLCSEWEVVANVSSSSTAFSCCRSWLSVSSACKSSCVCWSSTCHGKAHDTCNPPWQTISMCKGNMYMDVQQTGLLSVDVPWVCVVLAGIYHRPIPSSPPWNRLLFWVFHCPGEKGNETM